MSTVGARPPSLAAAAPDRCLDQQSTPPASPSSGSTTPTQSPSLLPPTQTTQYKDLIGAPLHSFASPLQLDDDVPSSEDDSSSNTSDADLAEGDHDQAQSLRDEVDVESLIAPVISRTQSNALYASAHASKALNPDSTSDDEPLSPLPPPKRYSGMLDVPPRGSATSRDSSTTQSPVRSSLGDTSASTSSGYPNRQSALLARPVVAGPPELKRLRPGFAEHKKRSRLGSFALPSLPNISLPSFASSSSASSGEKEKDKAKGSKKGHVRERSKTLILPRPNSVFYPTRAVTMLTGRTHSYEPETSPRPQTQHWQEEPAARPRPLRRASSVSALQEASAPLSRTGSIVSVSSSIHDDSKYANVHSQSNSRFKAIKDNFVDALPQLPALQHQFAALNPFSENATAMSAVPEFKQSAALDAIENITGDVVMLGGYRGSILRDRTNGGRRVWIPMKVGFNLRKIDLEVPLEPEAEAQMENSIYPDGMLTHIGPVDIGRRLMRRLRNNAEEYGRRVYDYGYDWRLSAAFSSKRLIEFLEKLPCNQVKEGEDPKEKKKGRGALVIAHSLGGLVVRHAINQRPELFSGVLFAGTPSHCVNILGPLRNGDSVLFNSKVFSAQVNFTLRSSYAFLPDDGHCFVDKRTGEPIPLDFFDASVWSHHALSPCVATRPILHAPSKLPLPVPTPRTLRKELHHSSHSALSRVEVEAGRDRTIAMQLGTSGSSHSPGTTSYTEQTSTLPLDKAIAYLQRTLTETKKFRQEMMHREDLEEQGRYPPMAVVYSKTTPTVTGARVDGIEAIRRSDVYDDLAFGAGDGVCLARAALLPKGYKCAKKVAVDRGHVSLLGDLEGVGRCLKAIIEQRGW